MVAKSKWPPYAATLAMFLSCAATVAVAQTTEPSVASAEVAEQGLAKAWESNDAQQLGAYLAPDWLVISTHGGTGDRDSILQGIQQGVWSHKTYVATDPRVKIYGDVALVTVHVETSGVLSKKAFDVQEVVTDVLVWENGAWKVHLSHESSYVPPAAK